MPRPEAARLLRRQPGSRTRLLPATPASGSTAYPPSALGDVDDARAGKQGIGMMPVVWRGKTPAAVGKVRELLPRVLGSVFGTEDLLTPQPLGGQYVTADHSLGPFEVLGIPRLAESNGSLNHVSGVVDFTAAGRPLQASKPGNRLGRPAEATAGVPQTLIEDPARMIQRIGSRAVKGEPAPGARGNWRGRRLFRFTVLLSARAWAWRGVPPGGSSDRPTHRLR